MKKKPLLYSLILMSGIYSCSLFNSDEGLLSLGVAFPQKSFTLKVIPEDTSTIKVEVTGEGLFSPINLSLSKTSPLTTVKVPGGNKQVKATAFNNAGKVLATGSNSVNIIINSNNKVEVTLEPVAGPLPTPLPTQPPVFETSPATPLPSVTITESPVDTSTPNPIFSSSAPVPTASPVPEATSIPTNPPPSSGSGSGSVSDSSSPQPTATPLDSVNARINVEPDNITVQPVPTPTPTSAV